MKITYKKGRNMLLATLAAAVVAITPTLIGITYQAIPTYFQPQTDHNQVIDLLTQIEREHFALSGQNGRDYDLIKQMLIEEAGEDLRLAARGAFDSVINRIASEHFPKTNTVEEVLKQRHITKNEAGEVVRAVWAYSYWGDDIHADMNGWQADLVDELILDSWIEYVHGEYVPHSAVTSYVAPWALNTPVAKYHRSINCVGYDGYHFLFEDTGVQENPVTCDQFVRPRARPECFPYCAPADILRPQIRPEGLVPEPKPADEVYELLASLDYGDL